MGTGWRRAFCTSIPRDPETTAAPEKQLQHHHRRTRQQWSPSSSPSNQTHSPGSCAKFGVFSGGGGGTTNPSSLRLRFRTASTASSDPPLLSPALDSATTHHCKATDFSGPFTPPPSSSVGVKGSPKLFLTRSNPTSPRSPSRFALLKAALRLSQSRCGICSQSVRAGQRTAVFTAECSHSFHFPCISAHVRSQSRSQAGCLSCPVCSSSWREVPLLSSAHLPTPHTPPPAGKNEPNSCKDAKQAASGKIYDDDEPLLLSSTGQGGGAAARFNPIPETDLEGEADGGNTYGVSGSSVEVAVMPEASLVSADRDYHNYAVLLRVNTSVVPQRSMSKVAASVLDPSCRAPIDLVTVLDVSGSMTAAKLQILKRAMRLLISSLGSADRLSVVAFSAGTKRLLPLVRMSRQGQRSARQIVDRLIVCGGGGGDSGCIGHALRKATKVLEDRRERNPVATIMLLSDSHQEQRAEVTESDTEEHRRTPIPSVTEAAATRFAHLEIPIGCSTGGSGGVNPVEHVFSKCVSGLVCVVMQDVHLQLTFPSGFVSAIYSYSSGREGCVGLPVLQGEGKGISVKLGDFYAEEKRELLVELKLPASAVPPQQQRVFMTYKSGYHDPITRELVLCRERSIAMPPLLHTAAAMAASRELRNLFITSRALVESRRLSNLNDLETAVHLLSTARSLLLQSNAYSVTSVHHKFISSIESRLAELHQRHMRLQLRSSDQQIACGGGGCAEQLTPTSAWRAAEQLAKVAILRKSMSRVGDLHGFENARF